LPTTRSEKIARITDLPDDIAMTDPRA
jgi:hypothetical protein